MQISKTGPFKNAFMIEAAGQSLIFAAGIAVFPVPIIVAILILLTPGARMNMLAFISGWLLGISLVGALALVLIEPYEKTASGEPAAWLAWLQLPLGCLLIYFAFRKLNRQFRHKGDKASPKWMGKIAAFSPWQSFGAGILLSGVNPKNIALIVGGITAVAETNVNVTQQAIALAIFTLASTLGIALPVIIYLAGGDHAAAFLVRVKGWMERNSGNIVAALFLLISVVLIHDAIATLSSHAQHPS